MKRLFGISYGLYGGFRIAAIALAAVLAAGPARAESTEETVPAKSEFHLFKPTPRDRMRDMSTDRPDTTESAYTVDAGHFQIEASFFDVTWEWRNRESKSRRSFAVAPMLLKAGLLNFVDIQLGIDPYTHERTRDRASDETETVQGFGDTVLRLKINLWGNDGGDTAFVLMPFIKFPTAYHDLGNRNFEGGLIAPLAIALPSDFSLGVMAEIDINRSAADDRYVVDFVHTVTVSHDLAGDLGGYVEYAGFANLSRDENYRGYFDAGLTWALTPDIQLDAGIRVGLTRASDDIGGFAGISVRF